MTRLMLLSILFLIFLSGGFAQAQPAAPKPTPPIIMAQPKSRALMQQKEKPAPRKYKGPSSKEMQPEKPAPPEYKPQPQQPEKLAPPEYKGPSPGPRSPKQAK